MKAIEDAIKLADLWRAGKMIGGDPYDVCDALLTEVNRLAEVNAELLGALEKARSGLSNGLWDYGPGQDEHEQCDELIDEIDVIIAKAKEQQ